MEDYFCEPEKAAPGVYVYRPCLHGPHLHSKLTAPKYAYLK